MEHFSYKQMYIHGFLTSMNTAQIPSQFGSTIGGLCLVVHQSYFPPKQKKVGTTGLNLLPWNLTWRTYNFLDNSMWHGSSAGNTDFKTFFLFPIHCLRFVSTKSNGGLNSKPDYAAKKMWNISAKPIKRSSHFTICISLRNHKSLQLLPQRRKKVHRPHQKPELMAKDSHKRKRTSLHISRMTQIWNKLYYKKFLTNKVTLMMMTLLVQQHHPHHQNLTIYKILRILTNYNTNVGKCLALGKMQRLQNNPARGKRALAKVKGNYFNKVLFLQVKQICRSNFWRQRSVHPQTSDYFSKRQNSGLHFRLLSAKEIPTIKSLYSCLDSRHLLLQKFNAQWFIEGLYKAIQIKGEGRANLPLRRNSLKHPYSPFLSQNCILFSANRLFQVFDKIHHCKYFVHKFYIISIKSPLVFRSCSPDEQDRKTKGLFIEII